MGKEECPGKSHESYTSTFWIWHEVHNPKLHQGIVQEVPDLASTLVSQVVKEEKVTPVALKN